MFERYRYAFAAVHLGFTLMAVHFGASVWFGGSPITPELYGPAVYAMPAIAWAAVQIVGAGTAAAGSIIGGRAGAFGLLFGGCLTLPFYAFLGVAASMAGQGVIVTAGCLWVAAPCSVLSIIAAWGAIKHVRG